MDRLFGFSLLLTYLSVIESAGKTESCLSQPGDIIWKKTGHNAVLSCTVSSQCSTKNLEYEWFAFKENTPLRLDLGSNQKKYILNGTSLHIQSLNVNDSGIYHCAAVPKEAPAPGEQYVGTGTTLEVKEVLKPMVRNNLLWLLFVLLAIYSLAVVTLIILKKHGCNKCMCKRTYTSDKNSSTRKKQFRNVLQEMYSKGNLEKSKQTAGKNRSKIEAASTEVNGSNGDIYQNV
ncbi:immunoglobulin superfamily member 6 [Thunnus albacares]|uniref:immunoglobulin superfamily member 6 n=1 Tax=Thunnus albacares TaxID=8236 RepID=UPI001CF6BBD7|nr:immunoglobulin superfamily member 6 [Thunnus albacares]